MPGSTEPGWLDPVTNPWEGEVEGWRLLGTGGQNLDDICKYVESEDRLGMMEAMCRWRCSAPTAPDTLCKSCTLTPKHNIIPGIRLTMGYEKGHIHSRRTSLL
jgi:DNA polymerase II small subunit/DNA polymerase delta subunit B